MPIQVEGHSSGLVAGVSNENRLQVEAETNLRGFFKSRDDRRLFNAVFQDASAAAGNYVAYLKNTSTTRILVVDLVRVGAVNAAKWKFFKVTGTGSGTTVTAVNMNFQSGIQPEATLLADNITGLTTSGEFATTRTPANTSQIVPFDDTLILGPQDAFAIEYDTGTTGEAAATVRFYYEPL